MRQLSVGMGTIIGVRVEEKNLRIEKEETKKFFQKAIYKN